MRSWSHNKHDFFEIGFNYRMTEFSAISLLSKLKFLNSDINKRNWIAKKYKDNLKAKNYSIFNEKIKKHSYHIFAITVNKEKRNNIIAKLKSKGIDTNIHYPYNLSELKVFNKKNYKLNSPIFKKFLRSFYLYPFTLS